MEGTAAGERGNLLERDERAPEHDGVAQVVEPAATGAARQLRVLARCEERVVVAGELAELLDDYRLGGHVDAYCQRLGGIHHFDEPLHETRLNSLLEGRHHPRVVGSDTRLQLREELAVPEHRQIGGVDTTEACLHDLADTFPLGATGQPDTGGKHRASSLVALVAAEDEADRGKHALAIQYLHDLEARGSEQPSSTLLLGGLAIAVATRCLGVEAHRIVVGAPVHEDREQV